VTADLSLQKLLQTAPDSSWCNKTGKSGRLERFMLARTVSGKTILGNGWYCSRCDRQHCYQPRFWQWQWGQHVFRWKFRLKRFHIHRGMSR
jgi:hypothetical protein